MLRDVQLFAVIMLLGVLQFAHLLFTMDVILLNLLSISYDTYGSRNTRIAIIACQVVPACVGVVMHTELHSNAVVVMFLIFFFCSLMICWYIYSSCKTPRFMVLFPFACVFTVILIIN